jgi:solute carrier family 66, member 2
MIKRSQNAEGFSNYVCLTLLIANILRIEFWFGKHFEIPLLIQSIIMIACMLIMLELCTRITYKSMRHHLPISQQNLVNGKDVPTELVEKKFTDFRIDSFWKWTKSDSCLIAFI